MTQCIEKSALVAEIKRKIEAHKETLKNCDSSISETVLKGSMSAYQSLLHFLDALETKEVQEENYNMIDTGSYTTTTKAQKGK